MSRKLLALLCWTVAAGAAIVVVAQSFSPESDQSRRESPSARPADAAPPADALSWPPPALQRPTTIEVNEENRYLELDPDRDYRIQMPTTPLTGARGLKIVGGRNVVLIGGAIEIGDQGPTADVGERRGLSVEHQTGTVHVEGLHIGGSGLSEGINVDGREGPVVQIQNVRIEQIRARDEVDFTDNHPDLIQSWSGPRELRVDSFTGVSDYQGIFLRPREFEPEVPLERVDLRRVNLVGSPTARHLLWLADDVPVRIRDVWLRRGEYPTIEKSVWPRGHPRWEGVRDGRPPDGDFVSPDDVGVGYESPGYRR